MLIISIKFKIWEEKINMKKIKSMILCFAAVSCIAQSVPVFASTNSESGKIPSYMAPGTVIQYDSNKEMKVLEEGNSDFKPSKDYKSSSNLPEIKPNMVVIYDSLGGPIVSVKKSASDLNTKKNTKVANERITTLSDDDNSEQGEVSAFDIWKEKRDNGTASGDAAADGAAHQTLPLYTSVTVANEENNYKSTVVRILDRGPYIDGRILDMADEAFSNVADLDAGHFYGALYW